MPAPNIGAFENDGPDIGALETLSATTFEYTGSGGLTIAGAAATEAALTNVYFPSGGVTIGGSAAIETILTHIYNPSGGIVIAGTAGIETVLTHEYTPSGGIIISGSAPLSKTFTYDPSGGIIVGGAAGKLFIGDLTEVYANLPETTVAAGGYTSGSGVLNVASTALPFKQTPSFRVTISDPTTGDPKVVLRVLSVVSSTQWLVEPEGSDASALFGDIVTGVLTEGALDRVRSNISRKGDVIALPSTTFSKDGDVFNSYDGHRYHFADGEWVPVGRSVRMGRVELADFTSVNEMSATLEQKSNGVLIRNDQADDALHLATQAAPGGAFRVELRVRPLIELVTGQRQAVVLAFRKSSNDSVKTLTLAINSGTLVAPGTYVSSDSWTDTDTYGSQAAEVVFGLLMSDIWLAGDFDGDDLLLQFSMDGINWENIDTVVAADFDQIGFGVETTGTATIVSGLFESWRVT